MTVSNENSDSGASSSSNFDQTSAMKSSEISESFKAGLTSMKHEANSWSKEVHEECFGCPQTFEVFEVFEFLKENWRRFVYNPYLPAFHKPGWLLDYALGPFNAELLGTFMLDFWAGITVALTLIPQVNSIVLRWNDVLNIDILCEYNRACLMLL